MLATGPGLTPRAWGLAHLAHVVGHPSALREGGVEALASWILVLSSAAQMLRPTLAGHVTMLVAMCARLFLGPPMIGTHAFILVAIGVAATAHELFVTAKEQRARDYCLWSGATYLCAAFWKLNPDFLSANTSCADAIAGRSIRLPGDLSLLGLLVVLCEVGFGIGILAPALRRYAAPAAVSFHLVLAFHSQLYFENFSAAMVALVFATDPDQKRVTPVVRYSLGAFALLLFTTLAVNTPAAIEFLQTFVVAFVLLVLSVIWLAQQKGKSRLNRSPPSVVGLAGLTFLLINAVTPLLEIKTAYAFNMYANSVTAAGRSNHFFLPRTLPITDFQFQRVLVQRGPSLAWSIYKRENAWIAKRSLTGAARSASELCVRVREPDGFVGQACAAPKQSSIERLLDKFFLFRRFSFEEPQHCRIEWGPAG